MPSHRKTYPIEIAGLYRELPLFEVQPGIKIALLNILGDVELVQACAQTLAERLAGIDYQVLLSAEAKSIPLAHVLSVVTGKPYAILRKVYRSYMGDTIQAETISITTGVQQSLYLDEKDRSLLENKRVVLVDDVISTGSTLQGMHLVVEKAGGTVVAEAAILTEGEKSRWEKVIALGHLPIFVEN